MKRSWIGFGILLALLALCLAVGCCLDRFQEPLTRQLDQAAIFVRQDCWPQARTLAQEVQGTWEQCRGAIACVADHTPMEEIDDLFAQLSFYEGDPAEYAAACAALSQKLGAISDAHRLSLWSFF